jgi:hypothetical protein
MYLPLWILPTAIYLIVIVGLLISASRDSGYFAGFTEFFGMLFATLLYLAFWVIYLALT